MTVSQLIEELRAFHPDGIVVFNTNISINPPQEEVEQVPHEAVGVGGGE